MGEGEYSCSTHCLPSPVWCLAQERDAGSEGPYQYLSTLIATECSAPVGLMPGKRGGLAIDMPLNKESSPCAQSLGTFTHMWITYLQDLAVHNQGEENSVYGGMPRELQDCVFQSSFVKAELLHHLLSLSL